MFAAIRLASSRGVRTPPAIACARRKNASLQGRIVSRHGETMRRREFIALMGASVAWPFVAMAQEPGRTYRLGCLFPLTRDVPVNAAFLNELRRRGFIEGQNLTVEWRALGNHHDGKYCVAPADRHAVIPEVIIWTASEALPVRPRSQPRPNIPRVLQNAASFSSASAISSSTRAFAVV